MCDNYYRQWEICTYIKFSGTLLVLSSHALVIAIYSRYTGIYIGLMYRCARVALCIQP